MSSVLESRPQIHASLQWIWMAFWDLHFTRPTGFGIQPISFSEIKAYCSLKRITQRNDVDDLVTLVRRMDSVCLQWFNKKGAKE